MLYNQDGVFDICFMRHVHNIVVMLLKLIQTLNYTVIMIFVIQDIKIKEIYKIRLTCCY